MAALSSLQPPVWGITYFREALYSWGPTVTDETADLFREGGGEDLAKGFSERMKEPPRCRDRSGR